MRLTLIIIKIQDSTDDNLMVTTVILMLDGALETGNIVIENRNSFYT